MLAVDGGPLSGIWRLEKLANYNQYICVEYIHVHFVLAHRSRIPFTVLQIRGVPNNPTLLSKVCILFYDRLYTS